MQIAIWAEKPKARRRLTDDEYSFIFDRVPRFCLDFAIVKRGDLLLAKRKIAPYKGYWSLPGGMLRRKESFAEAADRILSAELGLKPVSMRQVGAIEFLRDGPMLHSVSIVFLAELENGEIRGSYQADNIKFFNDLPKNVHPVQRKYLMEHRWAKIPPI